MKDISNEHEPSMPEYLYVDRYDHACRNGDCVMMKPVIGKIVYYVQGGSLEPVPAIILGVVKKPSMHDDEFDDNNPSNYKVTLKVMTPTGRDFTEPGVEFAPEPATSRWSWPPQDFYSIDSEIRK